MENNQGDDMTEQDAVSEQQYQTIWEQGQGEQPPMLDGDRMTHTTIRDVQAPPAMPEEDAS